MDVAFPDIKTVKIQVDPLPQLNLNTNFWFIPKNSSKKTMQRDDDLPKVQQNETYYNATNATNAYAIINAKSRNSRNY